MSVVIPCEPGGDPGVCLEALAALPTGERRLILEVWVAWGLNPPRQRNMAVSQAQGPRILFLDSDARAQVGLVSALTGALAQPGIAAAGGPNLPLDDESPLGLRFDEVLGSYAGSMASRARYRSVGSRRLCGEKELIACNLMVRRDAFLDAGGFNESLYPNEENELLNRLQARGGGLVYEPEACVRRPRRGTVGAFVAQAFRYGRGRARQMRVRCAAGDLVNLLPLALPLAWALCLAFCLAGTAGRWPGRLPLAYALGCFLAARLRPSVALFLVLRHHAYAAGLACGFFSPAPALPQEVRLERVAWDASAGEGVEREEACPPA